ncbi:MAG: hypothetical protein DRP85_01205 [Candidatus Makaraimicrobium thalassicum]|nr:MAG: hypothetical protein DRP85_01205 [Candidatus Omnitrophota bacterium]
MNNKGFTLTELLFVCIILIVMIVALVGALVGMNSVFHAITDTAAIENEARVAGYLIGRDLRRTSPWPITVVTQDSPFSGTDVITYKLPVMLDTDSDGVPDTPDLTGGSIQWNATPVSIGLDPADTSRLIRTEGAQTTLLAENVKSIRFLSHSEDAALYFDELKIILELEKTNAMGRKYNTVSTSIVDMRNSQ